MLCDKDNDKKTFACQEITQLSQVLSSSLYHQVPPQSTFMFFYVVAFH